VFSYQAVCLNSKIKTKRIMLCELSSYFGNNFVLTWLMLSLIAFVSMMISSSILFYYSYVRITYEKWLQKSNPKYPSVKEVRTEIILMLKGVLSGTFCPSLTLYFLSKNQLNGYCGIEPYGWKYLIISFFVSWLFVDFYEFFYHRMTHKYDFLWKIHKSHHQFFNPTPFSVIAEDYIDQIVGSSPLFILPLIFPINVDLLFFQVKFNKKKPNKDFPFVNFSLLYFSMHTVFICIGDLNCRIPMLIIVF